MRIDFWATGGFSLEGHRYEIDFLPKGIGGTFGPLSYGGWAFDCPASPADWVRLLSGDTADFWHRDV